MANDAIMFTVDASQIVAKMHFAALQATRGDVNQVKGFFVNTGIINDNSNGVPEKLGKTRFNLDNSSGKYYVGIVANMGFYQSFALDNAITDIFKLRSELYGTDKSLLDKNPDKANEMTTKFNSFAETIQKALTDSGENAPSIDDFKDEKKLVQIRDTLKNAISKNTNEKISTYNSVLAKTKTNMAKYLQNYMNVFAGSDNVKDITDKDVLAIQVSSKITGPNDKSLVKNFSIIPIPQNEKDALTASFKEKALKNPSKDDKDNCIVKMCFYVEYNLTIGDK